MKRASLMMSLSGHLRHEYWPHLLPLMLTSLEDEQNEVKLLSRRNFEQAGAKFCLEEAQRDKRVKEWMDFPDEQPQHYPPGEGN